MALPVSPGAGFGRELLSGIEKAKEDRIKEPSSPGPGGIECTIMILKLSGKLMQGAIQLTLAGILVRLIGLVNRMVLSRLIGAEGLGLFQMILPIYGLLVVTASLGLPGAVTKMVADRHALGDLYGQEKVLKLSLRLVILAAIGVSLLLWTVLALPLHLFPDKRIIPALRLMPAAFSLAALSSILRSFQQGRSNMTPTAVSQVAEQVIRVFLGLPAAFLLASRGLEWAVAGLMGGIIAGEMACFSFLYRSSPPRAANTSTPVPAGIFRELFALAFPILALRLSTAVTQTLESLLIPARLQLAGFSATQATALFGQFSGMALPLLFLPTVLIIPLNTALVPAIAGALTLRLHHRVRRLVSLSLWATLGIGIISGLVLYLAAPILVKIFYGDLSSARLVALLAPVAPLAYLQFTTAAILHGAGRPGLAVSNDLAGTVLSLVLICFLTPKPAWGISGVVCAYTAAFGLITLLDCLFIFRLLPEKRNGN
jgi:stage V sporulation protein B